MSYQFEKITDRRHSNSTKWNKYPDNILPMWIADMDFDSPPEIKDALRKIADSGNFGYTLAPPELLDVVIKRLKENHNWKVDPEWIVFSSSMAPSIFYSARLFDENDCSIIVNTPVYKPFFESVNSTNAELLDIPFIYEDEEWKIDFEKIQDSIKPNTKLFMLCNPQNPLGKVFSREELLEIIEFCKKNNLVIMSDEIHCDLILNENKKHYSIATLDPEIEQQSITLIAPSKTFNIASLGLTINIIPNKELREKFLKISNGLRPEISEFSYTAALVAYQKGENWRKDLIKYLKGNYELLFDEINSINGLSMSKMDATYLAWINYENLGNPNVVKDLEKAGLAVTDGPVFGMKNHFRLNFGTQRSRLQKALAIIKEVCNK